MSRVPFLKVEGAGNDFILFDLRPFPGRDGGKAFPKLSRSLIRRLCHRNRGIGSDGVLLLEAQPGRRIRPPRVRFWNPDGSAAAFCGNGARCVGLILLAEAAAGAEVEFVFAGRSYFARRAPGKRIAVLLPEPRFLSPPAKRPPRLPEGSIPGGGGEAAGVWVDAGVPHWILPVPSARSCDLALLGPRLRSWPGFGPYGTNVDLVEAGGSEIMVRTWERGVEGETEACGSGLLAAGFWAATVLSRSFPVRLRSRGGDRFLLRRDQEGRGLWLTGPARVAFSGAFDQGESPR